MRIISRIFGIILFLVLILPARSIVSADVGPKPPTLTVDFRFDIPTQEITGGELLLCEDETCSKFETVELVANSMSIRYKCEEGDCWLFFQGQTTRYLMLRIDFSDKTLTSNIFIRTGYDSAFVAEVTEDSLIIVPDPDNSTAYGPMQLCCFLPALILTILIEISIIKIFDPEWAKKVSRLSIMLVNIITVPIAWFVVPSFFIPYNWIVIIVESIAYVVETCLLFWINKRDGLTFKQAILASLLMNTASLFFYILSLIFIFQ